MPTPYFPWNKTFCTFATVLEAVPHRSIDTNRPYGPGISANTLRSWVRRPQKPPDFLALASR